MNILNILTPGMTVYSAVHGKRLKVLEIRPQHINPIKTVDPNTNNLYYFTASGSYVENGECMLFPSKENRSWEINNYSPQKTTYPSTEIIEFEPFTPVLVRNSENLPWKMNFFSHMDGDKYVVMCGIEYKYCIPYNTNNKHLLNHEAN